MTVLFLKMKVRISMRRYTPMQDRRSPPGNKIYAFGIYAVLSGSWLTLELRREAVLSCVCLLADANELYRGAVTAGEL